MGLMLSILVVCVGVIEALSCFEHFQYGVIHCATNVYENARRRSSVFLKYTSSRLKLLSENSISECEEPPLFESITFVEDSVEKQRQLSEEETDDLMLEKSKSVKTSTETVQKLQKEDKIQIVKALLEKPRRPKTVRSISMPELVHTQEDIELTKIINDLAIEPIEEVNETEDANFEVLSRKFDELFLEDEDNPPQDLDARRSPSEDLEQNICKNSDDLERLEETKFGQLEVENISIREENELKNIQKDLEPEDGKPKEEENDFIKMILEKEKPIAKVIKTNISQRVHDKGAAYFMEALSRRDSLKKGKSSRLDRSTSVDFSKVTSMMINKPVTVSSETSSDSLKLISDESISHNKLEDIILENDTPPGEVIDKTFDEIYENIGDEALDVTDIFEEIEKHVLEKTSALKAQLPDSQSPHVAEDQTSLLDDVSREGIISLSSGKTVSNTVLLKAAEQLAELLVRDSLNLRKIKHFIFENLNNCNEKLNSPNHFELNTQPENKRKKQKESLNISEVRTQKENVCPVQEMPDLKNIIQSGEKNVSQEVSNDECFRKELRDTVKKDDLMDVIHPAAEEFGKMSCSVLGKETSNLSAVAFSESDNRTDLKSGDKVVHGLGNEPNPMVEGFSVRSDDVVGIGEKLKLFSETENGKSCDNKNGPVQKGRTQEISDPKVEGEIPKGSDEISPQALEVLITGPTFAVDSSSKSVLPKTKMEKNVRREIFTALSDSKDIKTGAESQMESPHLNEQIARTQERTEIDNKSNKLVDVTDTAAEAVDDKNAFLPKKEQAIDFVNKEEVKPLLVEFEKPMQNIKSEICIMRDTISCGDSDVGENIQALELNFEPLLALEYKGGVTHGENQKERESMGEQVKKPEIKEMLSENIPEPQQLALEYEGEIISVENQKERVEQETMNEKKDMLMGNIMQLQQTVEHDSAEKTKGSTEVKNVENLGGNHAQKLHSDTTNEPRIEKTRVEGARESSQKDENDRNETQDVSEVRNECSKAVVITKNKIEVLNEENNFFRNKEELEPAVEKLQEEKPFLEESKKNIKDEIRTQSDAIDNEGIEASKNNQSVESKPEPLLALEYKKLINWEENQNSIVEENRNKTIEVKLENLMQPLQTGETALKQHDKCGVSEENLELEKVRIFEDSTTTGEKIKAVEKVQLENPTELVQIGGPVLKQPNKSGVSEENVELDRVQILEDNDATKEEKIKAVEEVRPENVMELVQTGEPLLKQISKCDVTGATMELERVKIFEDNGRAEEEKLKTMEEVRMENLTQPVEVGEPILKQRDTCDDSKENVEPERVGILEDNSGVREEKIKIVEEVKLENVVQPVQAAEPTLKHPDKCEVSEENVGLERINILKTDDAEKLHWDSKKETEPTPVVSTEKKGEHSSDPKNSNAHENHGATSSGAPEAFWLIFSGEYTKAMSKDWHSGHFSCWQCDEALTGQRYVLRDDHPYCIKCYESVFANVCEECNKIIGIDSKDLSYKDKHWHEACFLCNKCRVSLVDKQFGSKADKIYCGNCYDAQFASRCDGCGEIFRAGTKKMEYKTRQWHEKCFCCCVCKTPIGTKSFIPREQEIYCATCYEEKFATRCVKCNKIITSGGVTYKNEPWHRECFTCTNCNTSLAGQRFTSRDEKPYCADCFGELFAKRCTACSRPITGIGGTRFISFEDRHWHNDCFICASCKTSLVGRGFITDGDDIICPECAKQKLI